MATRPGTPTPPSPVSQGPEEARSKVNQSFLDAINESHDDEEFLASAVPPSTLEDMLPTPARSIADSLEQAEVRSAFSSSSSSGDEAAQEEIEDSDFFSDFDSTNHIPHEPISPSSSSVTNSSPSTSPITEAKLVREVLRKDPSALTPQNVLQPLAVASDDIYLRKAAYIHTGRADFGHTRFDKLATRHSQGRPSLFKAESDVAAARQRVHAMAERYKLQLEEREWQMEMLQKAQQDAQESCQRNAMRYNEVVQILHSQKENLDELALSERAAKEELGRAMQGLRMKEAEAEQWKRSFQKQKPLAMIEREWRARREAGEDGTRSCGVGTGLDDFVGVGCPVRVPVEMKNTGSEAVKVEMVNAENQTTSSTANKKIQTIPFTTNQETQTSEDAILTHLKLSLSTLATKNRKLKETIRTLLKKYSHHKEVNISLRTLIDLKNEQLAEVNLQLAQLSTPRKGQSAEARWEEVFGGPLRARWEAFVLQHRMRPAPEETAAVKEWRRSVDLMRKNLGERWLQAALNGVEPSPIPEESDAVLQRELADKADSLRQECGVLERRLASARENKVALERTIAYQAKALAGAEDLARKAKAVHLAEMGSLREEMRQLRRRAPNTRSSRSPTQPKSTRSPPKSSDSSSSSQLSLQEREHQRVAELKEASAKATQAACRAARARQSSKPSFRLDLVVDCRRMENIAWLLRWILLPFLLLLSISWAVSAGLT